MTTTLDATGLKCPLPVLRARKAMKDIAAGGELRVIATDPGALKDFEHFCAAAGHELVDSTEADGMFTFLIRKAT